MPKGQKHPSIKWKELRNLEPMSYREEFNDTNIALITGNTLYFNFIAFDFDCYEDVAAIDIAKYLIDQKYGNLPWSEAYQQTTPSGGVHYVFQAPKGVKIKSTTNLLNDNAHCVDIRAEGGLLVLAPSQAKSKQNDTIQPYVHTNDITVENAGMLGLAICESMQGKVTSTPCAEVPMAPKIQQATRSTTHTTNFFNEAISRCISNLVMTSEGARNEELNRQAFKMGTFVGAGIILYHEAHSMLTNAAQVIGLNTSEINATLSSGLNAGMGNPVKLPNDCFFNSEWSDDQQIKSIWPEPQPLEAPLAPVMSLSPDMMPKDMYDYSTCKAHNLDNAPVEFVAIPMLISYAATLGTSHVIKPKALDHDWKETPVLWGA